MNEASAPREPEPNLITQAGPLSALCSRLATADWIALDVEFVRDQTYYPQFCLLQVATPEFAAGVDPLALDNLDPLLDLIYRPDLTKVFHAGRQDIEILQMCRGTPPPNVFDTQIAAGFLGLPEQTGYATLIYEILGISLAKTHARTDWSRRPLSEAQLRYALDDVIYLAQAYPRLVARLESMGRLEWVHEECQGLLDPELYRSDPAQAWNRLGGIDRLSPTQLSVAQALAEWRESQAQARNLPRGWLLKDDLLLAIARQQPQTLDQLKAVRGLGEKLIRQDGPSLLALIAAARKRKPAALSNRAPAERSAHQEALLDLLTAVLRLESERHALAPGLVANRRELEQLLRADPACRLLHGWRHLLVGQELAALLSGSKSLRVQDGTLVIESPS